MKIVKMFVYFAHYFAIAMLGATIACALDYQVIDGTIITACLLAILIAVGSGVSLKIDDFGDHEEEDETALMDEENGESEVIEND